LYGGFFAKLDVYMFHKSTRYLDVEDGAKTMRERDRITGNSLETEFFFNQVQLMKRRYLGFSRWGRNRVSRKVILVGDFS
jgi:hypothetical protein